MHLGETLAPWNSKNKKCFLYKTPYVAAPVRVLGDIIAKPMPYEQIPFGHTYKNQNFFLVHDWRVSQETRLVILRLLHEISMWRSTSKSVTEKDYLSCLRSSVTSTFKWLIKDTLRWRVVMSSNLKNPTDQDDCKKETLSNQPRLSRVTPTVLLGSWVLQPIEDMMSFGTDFETHANWQGYIEVSTAKDFVARKVHTIALSKVQGTQ